MKTRPLPYYEPAHGLVDHISSSSKKHKRSVLSFVLKKTRNWLLQGLAYNCPVNSLRVMFHRWRGVSIGKGVMLGMHCILDNAYPEYIVLEDYCALAGHVYVLAHSNPYKHFEHILESYVSPVIVHKGAWIGVSTTLLSGAEIGEYSIITAGSIVTGKIPASVFARGNPAKVIAKYSL